MGIIYVRNQDNQNVIADVCMKCISRYNDTECDIENCNLRDGEMDTNYPH